MSIELHWLLLGLFRVFLTQCSVWEWEWARGPLSSAASHWLTAGPCTLPRAARPAVKRGGSVHHGAALTTGACQQRARYRPARRHRVSATVSSLWHVSPGLSPDCVIIIQLNINTQHKQPRKSRPQFSAAKHIERGGGGYYTVYIIKCEQSEMGWHSIIDSLSLLVTGLTLHWTLALWNSLSLPRTENLYTEKTT